MYFIFLMQIFELVYSVSKTKSSFQRYPFLSFVKQSSGGKFKLVSHKCVIFWRNNHLRTRKYLQYCVSYSWLMIIKLELYLQNKLFDFKSMTVFLLKKAKILKFALMLFREMSIKIIVIYVIKMHCDR